MPEMRLIGLFEHLVLEAVAAVEARAYGSRVYEKARELADKEVNAGYIYLTLNRLHKKGYLTAIDAKPTGERGWQPTKIYKLTADGSAALEASVKTLERLFLSYLSRNRERLAAFTIKTKAAFSSS